MKILFFVPYSSEGASNRFRIEQYLPFLRKENIRYSVRPFMSSDFYYILYMKGHFVKKFIYFICSSISRILDMIRSFSYDVIFIHRESYPLGPPFMERILLFFNKKIVFDFDDAIFLPSSSGSNMFMERLNRYGRVPEMIALSDVVITGNSYLADFALKYNDNVKIIPTCVDTDVYRPRSEEFRKKDEITIGWIGSKTTSVFLEPLRGPFKYLTEKYPNLNIKIVGGDFDAHFLQRTENIEWSLQREVAMLQSFDIGIMPMPDTKWTRGKCAFKAILYMSVGIPCVCSPVGMNKEIIEDGVDGFFAELSGEWENKLSRLIESHLLRRQMGKKARLKAEKNYSVTHMAPVFISILRGLSNTKMRKKELR